MDFTFDEDLASKVKAIISLLTFDDGRALNRKLTSARGWLSKCVAARDEVALLMKWDDLSPLYNVLGAGENIPDAQLSESPAPTAKEGNDISKAMGKLMKQYCTYLRSLDELEQDLKAALTSSTPRRRRRRKGASTPSSGGSSTPRSGAGTPDPGQVRPVQPAIIEPAGVGTPVRPAIIEPAGVGTPDRRRVRSVDELKQDLSRIRRRVRPVRPAIIEPNASRMPPNAGAGMATTKRKKPPSVTPSDNASVVSAGPPPGWARTVTTGNEIVYVNRDPKPPLPPGWTECMNSRTGQTYYSDGSRSQFEDPRETEMKIHAEIDAAAKARGFAGSVAPSSITFSGANNMKYTPEQRRLFAQAKKAYKEYKEVKQQMQQFLEQSPDTTGQARKLEDESRRLYEYQRKVDFSDPRWKRIQKAIDEKDEEISAAKQQGEATMRAASAFSSRAKSLRERAIELKAKALSLTQGLDPLEEADLDKAIEEAKEQSLRLDDKWEEFMADIDMLGGEEGNPELDDAATLITSISDLTLNSSLVNRVVGGGK